MKLIPCFLIALSLIILSPTKVLAEDPDVVLNGMPSWREIERNRKAKLKETEKETPRFQYKLNIFETIIVDFEDESGVNISEEELRELQNDVLGYPEKWNNHQDTALASGALGLWSWLLHAVDKSSKGLGSPDRGFKVVKGIFYTATAAAAANSVAQYLSSKSDKTELEHYRILAKQSPAFLDLAHRLDLHFADETSPLTEQLSLRIQEEALDSYLLGVTPKQSFPGICAALEEFQKTNQQLITTKDCEKILFETLSFDSHDPEAVEKEAESLPQLDIGEKSFIDENDTDF